MTEEIQPYQLDHQLLRHIVTLLRVEKAEILTDSVGSSAIMQIKHPVTDDIKEVTISVE